MTDLPERLRNLAESLEGYLWDYPLLSKDACIEAAQEIERLRKQIESAPKTLDGTIARPGLFVHGDWGAACIVKVCDGGEYGYTAEIADVEGPQGWVRLSQCYATPMVQGDSWENINKRVMEHDIKYAVKKIDESTRKALESAPDNGRLEPVAEVSPLTNRPDDGMPR